MADTNGSYSNPGSSGYLVWVYDYDSGTNTWSKRGNTYVVAGSNVAHGHQHFLSNDGLRLVSSLRQANYCYAYEWNGSSWSVLGGNISYGTDTTSRVVRMSKDGNTITTVNTKGNANRVFEYVSNSWVQKGQDLFSPSANIVNANGVPLYSSGIIPNNCLLYTSPSPRD